MNALFLFAMTLSSPQCYSEDESSLQSFCNTVCQEVMMTSDDYVSSIIYVEDLKTGNPIVSEAMTEQETDFESVIKKIDIPGTAVAIPLHYLGILISGFDPHQLYVDTSDGIYHCNDVLIEDEPYAAKGGLGTISCYQAFLKHSRVGLMLAIDSCYGRNLARYQNAMRKTSVKLIQSDVDLPDEDEENPFGFYSPEEILGFHTNLSFGEYRNFLHDLLLPLEPDSELSFQYANLRQAMLDYVRYGVGHLAYDMCYELAAITDVSYPDVNLCRLATFGGYYPAQKPRYLIVLAIKKRGNYGTAEVCTLARKIAGFIFKEEAQKECTKEKRYHPSEK